MIYYDIVTWVVKLFTNVAYDNYDDYVAYVAYDDFQHVNLIFSQKFISLFWGLFNDEIHLRASYVP